MSKRVMFIEPPFYRLFKDTYSLGKYPLAQGYLSAVVLEGTDWTVQAYNADFNTRGDAETFETSFLAGKGFENYLAALKQPDAPIWAEVEAAVADFAPDVLGISCKTQTFASAVLIAAMAKRANPEILVVIGGPHPTMAGESVLETSEIDIAVIGEGEETVVALLHALEKGEDLSAVNGILFRRDGKIERTPPRAFIADLNALPFPHAAAPEVLRDHDKYPAAAFGYVFATRGCPYDCRFCGSRNIWSRKVRYRSPENVVAEIKLLRTLGIEDVRFDDDTFGISKKYIAELCRLLMEQCPGIRWNCETVVPLIDDENLSVMKAAGCTSIQIGVESGNDAILESIHKKTTIAKALAAAALIRKHGIRLEVFFMVGHLHETEETLGDTMRAIRDIQADLVIFSIFTPYPGTDLFRECEKMGLIGGDYDPSLYNHQSPENCFSIHLDKERFRERVRQMTEEVDAINADGLRRMRRTAHLRAFLDELRRHGPLAALGKTLGFLARKLR